ncbi:MAG: sigma-70 family RNA polymerase sigma factor [Cyclobacteriaceae bacterium]
MQSNRLNSGRLVELERDKSSFESLTDLELWRKFKEGDEGAFVFIYKKYIDVLYQSGIQLTSNDALVKDCIQDFFISIREKISGLGDTDNIKLYLIKSFRRKVIETLGKHKRFIGQELPVEAYPVELATDTKMINEQFTADQLKKLNAAMGSLKAKDREIIYYYFYENLSYGKIAEILDYDHVSSARRSVYKVLDRLKKYLLIFMVIHFIKFHVL